MKKILVLSQGYPSLKNEFVFVKNFVDELSKSVSEIVVIAPVSLTRSLIRKTNLPPRTLIYNNVKIKRPRYISFSNLSIFGVNLSNLFMNVAIYFNARKETYDLVYSHFLTQAASGHFLSEKAKFFIILGEDKLRIDEMYPSWLVNIILSEVNGIVSLSKRNHIDSLKLNFPVNVFRTIIPNGYNPNFFFPRYIHRKNFGFKDEDFIIGFIGSNEPRKGFKTLIEAIKILNNKNIKLIAIGEIDSDSIYDYSNILLTGVLNQDSIAEYLGLIDIFCHPSLSEGSSNSIIEAMACGKPIIASVDSFNDDILRDNFSFRINVNSTNELAEKIEYCISNKWMLTSMGYNAWEFIKENTIKSRVEKFLDFTEQIK